MRGTLRTTWNALAALWGEPRANRWAAAMPAAPPVPVFWLVGKTQAGKSSIVRYLTGAEEAEIGSGFRACTRCTRRFDFPEAETPILAFLDTRGLDEPGYDPAADAAALATQAHAVIAAVRLADFAQATVIETVRAIRSQARVPVLLALTCLHEANAGHPMPYPFAAPAGEWPEPFARMAARHQDAFAGLADLMVPIDLTQPEDGFADPHYGGPALKAALLDLLPEAFRSSLTRSAEAVAALKDLHRREAGPVIAASASAAAAAAAMPVPFVDLLALPAIQATMVVRLAKLYGQEMSSARLVELAGTLGLGLLARQALREAAKVVPYAGSAIAASLAWVSTFALGRALCLYFEQVHEGHAPGPDMLKQLYAEQFAAAQSRWLP